MADTLSVLGLDPLHMIMQGSVIEITVAGTLIMKPNCCNADFIIHEVRKRISIPLPAFILRFDSDPVQET